MGKKRYEFDTWDDYYAYLKELIEPKEEPKEAPKKRQPRKKKED